MYPEGGPMRVVSFLTLLCLSGTLCADVLVLKGGERVGGRLVEKGGHYEITTDAGLRTYLKDEVEKVIKDPKEVLGDADRLLAEAKADYQRAIEIADLNQQSSAMKEAISKLTKARELTATTRELFPEDRYSDLDTKLVQIMQLMRLLRERVGSEFARRGDGPSPAQPAPLPPPVAAPPTGLSIEEAFSILTDAAKRGDAAQRLRARDTFRQQRAAVPELYEVSTAAALYLSKPEADWKMDPPTLAALQDYFAQPWLKDPRKITPAQHQAAAQWVNDKIASLKKASPAAAEPLQLFGIGHLGHAPAGAEQDKTARLLGLQLQNGILGTAEGFAVRDMNSWMQSGDFDLAVLAFVKEHRATDTPIVRYVWSYALLNLVQAKKRGWDRPVSAFGTVNVSESAAKDHIAALVKSIKTAANCNQCLGAGKLRCTNCHGKTEHRTDCEKCKGKGKVPESGYEGFRGRGFAVPEIPCYPCRGRGFMRLVKCEKCKEGWNDCRQCEKEKAPPGMEDICAQGNACAGCDGRGIVFRKILWACKPCMGLGRRLVPVSDPSKILP
jgi:hypothetical protein